MVIKLKIPINLFPNKKTLFNKSWKSTCQSGIWCDVLFKPFYNFWHYRIWNTFESKKKDRQNSWRNRGRQRGAIRFKHKNSGFAPIFQYYGTKKFIELHSNTVKSQAVDCLYCIVSIKNLNWASKMLCPHCKSRRHLNSG